MSASPEKLAARAAADAELERAFAVCAALGLDRPSTVELVEYGAPEVSPRIISRWAGRLTSAAKRDLVRKHERPSHLEAHRWEWLGAGGGR
jgi:hypothetical protein